MSKVKLFVLAVLALFIMFGGAGCDPDNPDQQAQIERAKKDLQTAQATVQEIQKNLPVFYQLLDTVCNVNKPPKWCEEENVGALKKDMDDALSVADSAIAQALDVLNAGKPDAVQVATLAIGAVARVSVVYARIVLIISRHK